MSLTVTGGLSFLDGTLTVSGSTITYAPTASSAAGTMNSSNVSANGNLSWTWQLTGTPVKTYSFTGNPQADGGYKGNVSGPPPTATPTDVVETDPWEATAHPEEGEKKKTY